MSAAESDMSLSHELKTRVDESTGALLRRRANLTGCGVSDLLRDMVYMVEHGMTHGEWVAKPRRAALEVNGPTTGQGRAE